MKKEIISIILLLVVTCSTTDPTGNRSAEYPFYTNIGTGGGVVFFQEDSTFLIRLQVGTTLGEYISIHYQHNDWNTRTVTNVPLTGENASLCKVIGGDQVLPEYSISSNESYISVTINDDYSEMSGEVTIAGIQADFSDTIRIAGQFTLQISEIGQNDWECSHMDSTQDCRFIED